MGAVAQRAQAGEMVGMQMGIDRLDQSEVEFVDELDITVDLLQHRIDDQRLAPAPAGDEVGVGAGDAVEELAKNHPDDSPIQGLRIPLEPREQYKSSLPVPKGRRRLYSLDHLSHRRGDCGGDDDPDAALEHAMLSSFRFDREIAARSPFRP